MKRWLIISLFGVALIVVLLAFVPEMNRPVDWRESYKKNSNQPMGTSLVHERLKDMFPKADITATYKRWSVLQEEDLVESSEKKVFVLINSLFAPTADDLAQIRSFAEAGNTVFIAAHTFYTPTGYELQPMERFFNANKMLELTTNTDNTAYHFTRSDWKKETYSPVMPQGVPTVRSYFSFSQSVIENMDSNDILVRDESNHPVMVREQCGLGNIYVCSTPQMFTNYHLLKKKNAQFIERAFAYLPADADAVIWDEFYKGEQYNEADEEGGQPDFLKFVMQHEPLRWAFWLFLVLVGVYVASEVRRKQRIIPVIPPKPNTTLDFTETIGRLYYRNRDHKNIAEKKIKVFFEAIRNRYQLATTELDAEFERALTAKSGVDGDLVASICRIVAHVRRTREIEEDTLIDLSGKIDAFYAQTIYKQSQAITAASV